MTFQHSADYEVPAAYAGIDETEKYPRHVRVAIILGSSAALWALLIAGLWRLIA